jgi:hypothetical protein
MTLWKVLAVTSSETRPEAGIRDTRPRNIALRSFPQARHVAAGQRTATLRRTSTQVEAARALQLGLRPAGSKEPGPWIHHLGRLLRHPSETMEVEVHIVLNRQDTYRKAGLPTVKHGPALPRPSAILDSTLPVHQDRARGLVALQAARLRRLIISRRIARLVRQERVLAPLATPTELATILLVTVTLLQGLTAPTRLRHSRRAINARLAIDLEAGDSRKTVLQRRTNTGTRDSPKE